MDLYVILGVERSASAGDLKRAYRRLARKYHPDINPGDRETAAVFRRMTEAYETLVDPERRRDYDAHGLAASPPPAGDIAFEGFDFSGASAGGDAASSFGDLFAEVIAGSGRRPPGEAPAVDLHATPADHVRSRRCGEGARGHRDPVAALRRPCGGAGARRVAEGRCFELRRRRALRAGCGGTWCFSRRCADCGGDRAARHRPCGVCAGARGSCPRIEALAVAVPAGVTAGTRLRVSGGGKPGRRGEPHRDLYVTVAVDPHPLFRARGDDLHLVLPIAVHEAAWGRGSRCRRRGPGPDAHPRGPSRASGSACASGGPPRRARARRET